MALLGAHDGCTAAAAAELGDVLEGEADDEGVDPGVGFEPSDADADADADADGDADRDGPAPSGSGAEGLR